MIIEDPKMLETLERKVSDVIAAYEHWQDRAEHYKYAYDDAVRRARRLS